MEVIDLTGNQVLVQLGDSGTEPVKVIDLTGNQGLEV